MPLSNLASGYQRRWLAGTNDDPGGMRSHRRVRSSAETAKRTAQGASPKVPSTSAQVEKLTAQIRDLEQQVSKWRRRAEVAKARAKERDCALDARQIANEAERMLTAGTPPVQTSAHRGQGWRQVQLPNVPPSQSGTNGSARWRCCIWVSII